MSLPNVQPIRLVHGLAARAQAGGCAVHEHSRVTRLDSAAVFVAADRAERPGRTRRIQLSGRLQRRSILRARKRITFRTILLLRRTEARGDGDGGCSSNADRSHEAPD